MNRAHICRVFFVLAWVGCKPFESRDDFVGPLDTSTGLAPTPPDPSYEIPADDPRGHLTIEPPSMTDSTKVPGLDLNEPLDAVRLAFAVTNRSDDLWFLDRSEQKVQLTTRRRSVELHAVAPRSDLSSVFEVKPHTQIWIVIYFHLPPGFQGHDAKSYLVDWVVHTGKRRAEGSASFE